jgi:hypothetical protein
MTSSNADRNRSIISHGPMLTRMHSPAPAGRERSHGHPRCRSRRFHSAARPGTGTAGSSPRCRTRAAPLGQFAGDAVPVVLHVSDPVPHPVQVPGKYGQRRRLGHAAHLVGPARLLDLRYQGGRTHGVADPQAGQAERLGHGAQHDRSVRRDGKATKSSPAKSAYASSTARRRRRPGTPAPRGERSNAVPVGLLGRTDVGDRPRAFEQRVGIQLEVRHAAARPPAGPRSSARTRTPCRTSVRDRQSRRRARRRRAPPSR